MGKRAGVVTGGAFLAVATIAGCAPQEEVDPAVLAGVRRDVIESGFDEQRFDVGQVEREAVGAAMAYTGHIAVKGCEPVFAWYEQNSAGEMLPVVSGVLGEAQAYPPDEFEDQFGC